VVALASGYELGAAWLIVMAGAGLAALAAGLARAPARRRLIARAWCVITPHRVRAGCRHAWVQAPDGRLPVILYTTPAGFGERVALWCPAGITRGDLEGARDVLRAACWARDVRVVASMHDAHVVALEVIRHLRPPGPPDDTEPEEPALFAGLGHHRPFG
jgi:hypothetical protein